MYRVLTLSLVSVSLLFAGCLGAQESADTTPGTSPGAAAPPATLPEPIEASETVVAGADPFNAAMMAPCSQDVSACYRYPFTLAGNATIDASLTWGLPASDFDLYVVQGESQVATSASAPPGTSEAIKQKLKAGDYELVVVAWAVPQDTFTVKASFTAA